MSEPLYSTEDLDRIADELDLSKTGELQRMSTWLKKYPRRGRNDIERRYHRATDSQRFTKTFPNYG